VLNSPNDPYDLGRFVQAQEATYRQALSEIRAGRKRSHWSWYILPQMKGLGSSPMSTRYAIGSLDEAKAYLGHPLLGARLRECVAAMNEHTGMSANEILGEKDARKFHSCLTLFAQAAGSEPLFSDALTRYFSGVPDAASLALLRRRQGPGEDER
jgi:uncharacterized protein (DUF1810 family)